MKTYVPIRKLRQHPDLDQLRRQAKELLDRFLAGDADAVADVNAHYHGAHAASFALHDAQLVLARSHGFDSWPKLKAFVDGVTVQPDAEPWATPRAWAEKMGHAAVLAVLRSAQ